MTVPAIVAVTLTLLQIAPPAAARQRKLEFPTWAVGASCSIETVNGERQPLPAATVDCGTPSGRLSCDFENGAPIDFPLSAVCARRGFLPVEQATRVVIAKASGDAGSLTVRWLAAAEDGALTVLAERSQSLETPSVLRASDRMDRFLQFARPGAAPVTVSVPTLSANTPWQLPEPRPGGEVLVSIDAATVLPRILRLEGPTVAELITSDGPGVFMTGVPAGEYTLTPSFEGGVQGPGRRVLVRNGESTTVHMRPPAVGGVHVMLGDEQCASVSQAGAIALADSSGKSTISLHTDGRCDLRIGGLPPSRYDVVLTDAGGVLARTTVSVTAQTISPVRLGAIHAHGTVVVNGVPASGLTLHFTALNSLPDQPLLRAETDAEGAFDVTLPIPSRYRLEFLRGAFPLLGHERELLISDGTVMKFEINGGSLVIDIQGWDRSTPVNVTLTKVSPLRPGTVSVGQRVRDSSELPILLDGAEFGTFRVQAVQESSPKTPRRVSQTLVLSITAEQPNARAVLNLSEYSADLVLHDSDGLPVRNAQIGTRDMELLPEIAPGVYSLATATPATQLLIQADGYSTACEIAPDKGTLSRRLQRGQAAAITFVGYGDLTSPPGRVVWPDTRCPVPLSQFKNHRGPGQNKNEITFFFEQFPLSTDMWFIQGAFDTKDAWQQLQLGIDGGARLVFRR